jgi:hypothetical protein
MGGSYGFASRETSRRVLQVVINQGGLVLMLASGLSTCPKDARDLTFQPFVGIMGADPSICFLLEGGIFKVGGLTQNLEICVLPGSRSRWCFPGFICRQGQLLVG